VAPLAVGEQVALFEDGWLGIARLSPFRVDWLRPDGQVVSGAPLQVERLPVTPLERDAYFERARRSSESSARLPEEVIREQMKLSDLWPREFPPFVHGMIAGGDGTLWLRRPASRQRENAQYLVAHRGGGLIGVVSMPDMARIVAVSRTSVYVAKKGRNGEQLQRHRLPY
jgi:hypothetical protein